jgi:hypothetical protein
MTWEYVCAVAAVISWVFGVALWTYIELRVVRSVPKEDKP